MPNGGKDIILDEPPSCVRMTGWSGRQTEQSNRGRRNIVADPPMIPMINIIQDEDDWRP